MTLPRNRNSRFGQEVARRIRNGEWALMKRLDRQGMIYVCLWNKYGRRELPNEHRLCLMGGLEVVRLLRRHRDWFGQSSGCSGHHNDCIRIWLTPAGRRALRHRQRFDMEPVTGGLVGRGYRSRPLRADLMPFPTHRTLKRWPDAVTR